MIYVPEILLSLSTLNWVSTKGLLALASCREFRAKQQCWQNPQMQKCHLTAQQHRTAPSCQGRAAGIPFPLHFTWADVKMQRPQHHGGIRAAVIAEDSENHKTSPISTFLQHQPRNAQTPTSCFWQRPIKTILFYKIKKTCCHQELPQEIQGWCSSLLAWIHFKKTIKYCSILPILSAQGTSCWSGESLGCTTSRWYWPNTSKTSLLSKVVFKYSTAQGVNSSIFIKISKSKSRFITDKNSSNFLINNV